MLQIFRRHYPPCPYKSRRYRRCNCPLWVQGSVGGEWIKKSLNVTSWEAASDLVTAWTASGQIGVVRPDIPPLKEAVEKFIADAKAQQLNWETLRKYETFLDRRFLPWCESKGYRLLKQITPSALADFRKTWQDGALYATKNIERLRSFFRFCGRMKWASENPALALKGAQGDDEANAPVHGRGNEKAARRMRQVSRQQGAHQGVHPGDALLRASHRRHDRAQARPA